MSATLIGLGLCIDDLGSTYGTTSAPPIAPGTIVDGDNGARYMFVFNTGATTAITQYYPAFCHSTNNIAYVADTSTTTGVVVGVACTALATKEYGWVQIAGMCTVAVTTTITVGSALVGGAACLRMAAATSERQVGVVAYGTAASGTIIAKLNIG